MKPVASVGGIFVGARVGCAVCVGAVVGDNVSVGASVVCVIGASVGATRSVRVVTTGISVRNAGAAAVGAAKGDGGAAGGVSTRHAVTTNRNASGMNKLDFIFDLSVSPSRRTDLEIERDRLSIRRDKLCLASFAIFGNGTGSVWRALSHSHFPHFGYEFGHADGNCFGETFGRAGRIFRAGIEKGHAPIRICHRRAGCIHERNFELKVWRVERLIHDARNVNAGREFGCGCCGGRGG